MWFGTQDYHQFQSELSFWLKRNRLLIAHHLNETCSMVYLMLWIFLCLEDIRHDCKEGDQLDSYRWTEHDLRQGGVEVIKDSNNNAEIKIEWLKVPGGEHGGSWAARISGRPLSGW
jgi:hypothetical protein